MLSPPVLFSPPPLSPQVAAKRATVYLLLPEQPPLASDAPPSAATEEPNTAGERRGADANTAGKGRGAADTGGVPLVEFRHASVCWPARAEGEVKKHDNTHDDKQGGTGAGRGRAARLSRRRPTKRAESVRTAQVGLYTILPSPIHTHIYSIFIYIYI